MLFSCKKMAAVTLARRSDVTVLQCNRLPIGAKTTGSAFLASSACARGDRGRFPLLFHLQTLVVSRCRHVPLALVYHSLYANDPFSTTSSSSDYIAHSMLYTGSKSAKITCQSAPKRRDRNFQHLTDSLAAIDANFPFYFSYKH